MPSAPALHIVHWWRDRTWHWQDLDPTATRSDYFWVADHRSTTAAKRWKIAWTWYYKQVAAHTHYVNSQTTAGVPAWFYNAMSCISDHEEYGFAGKNTSAGKIGLIYSPSEYIEPGPTLARQYGDSWLFISLPDQLRMALSLYNAHGNFSPWSTAPLCGLA